jgi:hypothetical protein
VDYAQQRYYGQAAAFLSPDPGGVKTAIPRIPLSWNRYAYAGNDPINHRDRTGRIWACVEVNGEQDCEWEDEDPTPEPPPPPEPVDPTEPQGGQGGAGGGPSGGTAHSPGSNIGPPGYRQALNALANASADCLKDINARGSQQAVNALVNSKIVYDYGLIPIEDPDTRQFVGKATPASEDGNTISINLNFGYFTPNNVTVNFTNGGVGTVDMTKTIADSIGVQAITTTQYQVLVLLHELGHILGKPQEQDNGYNAAIFRDCVQ